MLSQHNTYNRRRVQEIVSAAGGALTERSALEVRVIELEAAIRTHRDERGDDRCWLDDNELYAVLGDTTQPVFTLPPRAEFLGNCARFWECRQKHANAADAVKEYKSDMFFTGLPFKPLGVDDE